MPILVLIAVLVVGAFVTWIGAWLIGWIHPPRGRFVEINGLRQHVVELGEKSADAADRPHSRRRLQSRGHAACAGRAARRPPPPYSN